MSQLDNFHRKIFGFLWKMIALVLCVLLAVIGLWYFTDKQIILDSKNFEPRYVEIAPGATASQVAKDLQTHGLIASKQAFLLRLKASNKEESIAQGVYYFEAPLSMSEVIGRITNSVYGLPTQSITLFEGEANFVYAKRLAETFEHIDEKSFLVQAQEHEGYLFPDTYQIAKNARSEEVVDILMVNFKKRIAALEQDIMDSPYTLDQIITMASLVETEAGSASYETKQRVAGILWRRLDIGMLLQADAVFSYIYQEHLPRVLFRHLEVDSPYNLYKYTGLPPGPIANPGLDSIRATLEPHNPEGYLYYLTGNNGSFHYSTTLAGHEQNRRSHLQY